MAIARDSVQDFAGASGTSQTNSFTNTAGTCLLLFAWRQQALGTAGTATYAGTAMNYVGDCGETLGAIDTFILYSPATGANNIVYTLNSGAAYIRMIAVSYSGTITSGTTPDGHLELADASTGGNITVTATGCWVAAVQVDRTGNASMTGAGVLASAKVTSDTDITLALFDSNGTVGTGSQAFSTTGGSSNGSKVGGNDNYIAAMSFAPAAAASAHNLSLLGVGT